MLVVNALLTLQMEVLFFFPENESANRMKVLTGSTSIMVMEMCT
jgi:hypothetical protein